MTRFKFVHAADLHLDTPFQGLGRVEPSVAEILRDQSLAAWDALVELCVSEGAAFLVLAGDIYDGEARGLRAQLRFLRGLERLSSRGIASFIAYGNHDPDGARWSAIREWPPGVTIFGCDRVRSVRAMKDETPLAVVHGVSHASREVGDNLAVGFSRGREAGFHIGVLHCNVEGNPDHALYAPCSLADLRRAGMDYWALGHVHAHQVVSAVDPVAVYPGTLQGRSLKRGERDVKGAVVVTVEGCRTAETRFVPVKGVRFAELAVDASGASDIGALRRRLERAAAAELDREPSGGLVLRARITGHGRLHAELRSATSIDELLRALREESLSRRPFAWWSAVACETEPAVDLEAVRRRGDFAAELLRLNDSLRADPAAMAAFVTEETAALRSPVLRRWTAGATTPAQHLFDRAEALALEQLEARSTS